MADKKGTHSSPSKGKRLDKARPIATNGGKLGVRYEHEDTGRGGKHPHAERRIHDRSGCYNPEVRRGIGAVVFALGFPALIAGIVMTVVAATDNDNERKYPTSFSFLGPILIVLSVLLFLTGIALTSSVVCVVLRRCFSLDDPNGCCRVRCPSMARILRPDDTALMNQKAMNALKTEPGKSALKRQRNLSDNEENYLANSATAGSQHGCRDDVQVHIELNSKGSDVLSELNNGHHNMKLGGRGVRFSETDGEADDFRRPRAASSTSDSSSSVLSLRHCKVHPSEEAAVPMPNKMTDEAECSVWHINKSQNQSDSIPDGVFHETFTTEL